MLSSDALSLSILSSLFSLSLSLSPAPSPSQGSFTVLSVKAISSLLLASFAGVTQFDKPLIYCVAAVLIFTAVTQVRFLNYAMQHFDSTEVVPTFFVMFTRRTIRKPTTPTKKPAPGAVVQFRLQSYVLQTPGYTSFRQ